MTQSTSEQRMVQNQVAFREVNKHATDGFEELKAIAEEEGVGDLYVDPNMTLMFVCECSDENCTKRIKVTLGEYNKIHQSSKQFIISNNHEVPQIEDVIQKKHDYIIVEKHKMPPRHVKRTVKTDVNNTNK